MCGGKKKYSKDKAHEVRGWVGRKRDKDMRIYKCPKCHMWHITSQKGLHIDDYT